VGNNWNVAVNRPALRNWPSAHPERIAHWNQWGGNVRHHWQWHGYHNQWFHGSWWNSHFRPGAYPSFNNWHYGWCANRYPWRHWWTVPTYVGLTSWFAWSAPPAVWAQPVYYDYGQGGNVTTTNNIVYVDGQAVGSEADHAAESAALAAVHPPASEKELEESDWMPLGTFAVSTGEADEQPSWIVQLAVNKQGVVSGTLYNVTTDDAKTLLGQVDKNTQRVAVRVGEGDLVLETGLYNLTQAEAPALVHFAADRTENWLLVRLEAPEEEPQE
jgi:hypothetical protein